MREGKVKSGEVMLQWGRNFFVAEIGTGASKIDYRSKLQWGRNFFVAEMIQGMSQQVITS